MESLFKQLTLEREDSPELVEKMVETVVRLDAASNVYASADRPGMLLGKIQSGKTRAFIGIMAKAFDEGYDFSIVLTKGTQALSEQTMKRLARDFASAIEDDRVRVYDIIKLPKNLTQYHLRQKWIIVAKKEKNNLKRIFQALETHYPDLKEKRLLIIDDEADYATLAFRKSKDTDDIEAGKIAQWIDELREKTAGVSFLQVTATPYSLYLQPNNQEDSPLFHPVRPAFTVPLPTYPGYAGGDFFFGESEDPESPASFAFHEVFLDERNALRKEDRRSFKLEEALTSPKVAALRIAILNFVTGGSIRRMQQLSAAQRREKYAFMVHTESARRSHNWQEEIVRRLLKELVRIVKDEPFVLQGLVRESYEDLERSLKLGGEPYPGFDETFAAVTDALVGDEVMVSIVNSESQVKDQLDDEGQLRLDAPLNVFIGGQILDRGITIRNLIGFYYGRNPQSFQQDTVLQHARLYGARPMADLLVTRFYTTDGIHQVMKRIHDFDSALRTDIEKGDQGEGVYFLRRDGAGQIIPCSPNKILASDIVTIRPHRRLQPIGFQTGYKSYIGKLVLQLDEEIHKLMDTARPDEPVLISMSAAASILRHIEKTLEFEDDEYQWDFAGHIAALEHLSNKADNPARRGQVWLFVRTGRNLARFREGGRYSNEPLSYQERPLVNNIATESPVLSLVRQEGSEAQGWRGTPFWWPIITPPTNTATTIFASRTRGED
jgi:hypothetical protein